MITKENLNKKITYLKRLVILHFFRTIKNFGKEKKISRPKKLNEAEKTVCEIFIALLLNKDSKLYYDIQTQECYISSGDKTLFIFLETMNVKVINSVFGYDVHIGKELESYLLEKFIREMAIRRNAFKNEVLSKINHSLDSTLEKIKNFDKPTK